MKGSTRDVWIPLERVSSGELRLQIEAVRVDDQDGSRVCIFRRKFVVLSIFLLHNIRKDGTGYDIFIPGYYHFSCLFMLNFHLWNIHYNELFTPLKCPGLRQWLD